MGLHGRKNIVECFQKAVIDCIIARRQALACEPRGIEDSVMEYLGGVKIAGKGEEFFDAEMVSDGGTEFFERIHGGVFLPNNMGLIFRFYGVGTV